MLKISKDIAAAAVRDGVHVCLDVACAANDPQMNGQPCLAAMGHYPNHPADGPDHPGRCLRCNQLTMKFVSIAQAQGLIEVV